MHEGLKQVPGDNGMKVNFGDLMSENGVIVFPTFFNTQQKVLNSIRIFQLIEPRPVNQLIIQRLCTHIILHLKLFLNDIEFREPVRELGPFVDLVEVIVVKTVNVESLGFAGLLVLDGLLQFVHQVTDQLLRVRGQGVADQALLQPCGRLLDQEWNVHVLLLLEAGHGVKDWLLL